MVEDFQAQQEGTQGAFSVCLRFRLVALAALTLSLLPAQAFSLVERNRTGFFATSDFLT